MEVTNQMAKEITEDIRAEEFVKLKSISILKSQSKFLYDNKISPQKLLAKAINELMEEN
jgi:hypothetical protein